MREILFRGKLIDNGEWVYGFAIFADNKAFILNNAKVEFVKGFNENRLNFVLIEVIPETVGQYINKTDKNGKKIFNDDIVAFKRNGTDFIGSIIFNKDTASFEIRCNEIIGSYGETSIYKVDLSACDEIKVFGNIHDNHF